MNNSKPGDFQIILRQLLPTLFFTVLTALACSAQARGDNGYSDYARPYHDRHGQRSPAYRDNAFGRYKYPRGRPIPGDSLNRNNRPGDGLNYGHGNWRSEPYPDFRQHNQRRRFSDNSGPRQSDYHQRAPRDGWHDRPRRDSRRDYWQHDDSRRYGERYHGSPSPYGYQNPNYHGNYHDRAPQRDRRPSSNNYRRPHINR